MPPLTFAWCVAHICLVTMAATYRIRRVEDTPWHGIAGQYARCGAEFGFIVAPGSDRCDIRHTSHWRFSHTASTTQRRGSFQRVHDEEGAPNSLHRPPCLYARTKKNKVESSNTDEPQLTVQVPDEGAGSPRAAECADYKTVVNEGTDVGVPADVTAAPKRKRGRPRKVKVEDEAAASATDGNNSSPETMDDNASAEPDITGTDPADVVMSATTSDEDVTQQPIGDHQDAVIDTNQEFHASQEIDTTRGIGTSQVDHVDVEVSDGSAQDSEVGRYDVVDTATEGNDEIAEAIPTEDDEVGEAIPTEDDEVAEAIPTEDDEVGEAIPTEDDEVGEAIPTEDDEVAEAIPTEDDEVGEAIPTEDDEEVAEAIPTEDEEVGEVVTGEQDDGDEVVSVTEEVGSVAEVEVTTEDEEGMDEQGKTDASAVSGAESAKSADKSGAKGPRTFLQRLEEQLASRRTRLPESFYAEEVYSTFDNTKLPEGCKTLMDFFNLPKNFDFKSMVDLSLHGTDSLETLGVYGTDKPQKLEEPVYSGKYPDSFFETIFHYEPEPRRYTTAEGTPESVEVDRMYYTLKGKRPGDIVPPERQSPVEKIREHYMMFDVHDHLKHYLTHLNQYNYRVLSSHHKRDDTLNHYLNNEYIQYIPKKFPPEPDHTEKIRAYFMDILPELMDTLVNLIKNDPNKDRTPSPPLHDMSFAPGFQLPDYMQRGYETDDERTSGFEEKDYLRFSSLQGLHDPERHLHYPYADVEPLYQRQLLSTYLDLVKTGELGEPDTYKKFKSQAASIRNELYTDRTKLPQEIYGRAGSKEARKPIERTTRLTKVYERGGRKRSVALVYLEPGNGHIIINNRDGYQYVRYSAQRIREMLEPLDVLYAYKKFNIVAVARGGGISGQTGAIRHALARYLTKVLVPKIEPYLSMRDLTKADTRQVERKKTNLRKARKEEHYSKR